MGSSGGPSQPGALNYVSLKHRCEVCAEELFTAKPYLDRCSLEEIPVKNVVLSPTKEESALKENLLRGAWVAQWVKASAFGSGHDLRVLGWSPAWGSLLRREPASLPLSACLSAYLSSLSLSLSLSNK